MYFSTRHRVSSNRSNAETWMTRPAAARQEPERCGPESRLWAAVVERGQHARTARPTENNRNRVSRRQETGWNHSGGGVSESDLIAQRRIIGQSIAVV